MLAVYMVAMDIIAKYKIAAEGERLPPPAEGGLALFVRLWGLSRRESFWGMR